MSQIIVCDSELADLAQYADFPLDENSLLFLRDYLSLLMLWNRKMNLVGTHTWQDAFCDLIVDCLHLADFMMELPLPGQPTTWDPGAGAGLPGIPLRLIWQRGDYWMIEAREKRSLFLNTVLARHPLPGVRVFHGRMETFMMAHTAPDCVVSRAFMPWNGLLELLYPCMRQFGIVVFMTNEPVPVLPENWRVVSTHAYASGCAGRGRRLTRHFWATMKIG